MIRTPLASMLAAAMIVAAAPAARAEYRDPATQHLRVSTITASGAVTAASVTASGAVTAGSTVGGVNLDLSGDLAGVDLALSGSASVAGAVAAGSTVDALALEVGHGDTSDLQTLISYDVGYSTKPRLLFTTDLDGSGQEAILFWGSTDFGGDGHFTYGAQSASALEYVLETTDLAGLVLFAQGYVPRIGSVADDFLYVSMFNQSGNRHMNYYYDYDENFTLLGGDSLSTVGVRLLPTMRYWAHDIGTTADILAYGTLTADTIVQGTYLVDKVLYRSFDSVVDDGTTAVTVADYNLTLANGDDSLHFSCSGTGSDGNGDLNITLSAGSTVVFLMGTATWSAGVPIDLFVDVAGATTVEAWGFVGAEYAAASTAIDVSAVTHLELTMDLASSDDTCTITRCEILRRR